MACRVQRLLVDGARFCSAELMMMLCVAAAAPLLSVVEVEESVKKKVIATRLVCGWHSGDEKAIFFV